MSERRHKALKFPIFPRYHLFITTKFYNDDMALEYFCAEEAQKGKTRKISKRAFSVFFPSDAINLKQKLCKLEIVNQARENFAE